MPPEEFATLHTKLDSLQETLEILEAKENRLIHMLEQVQRKLDVPAVVVPRFSKRVTIIASSLLGVWTIAMGVVVVSILTR